MTKRRRGVGQRDFRAETLHLSESTVEAHFGRILTKLDLPNRAQAVILAYELGIV